MCRRPTTDGPPIVAQIDPPVSPITGMGLNVSQPGRFKDPRSGDYFSIDQNGTIEFYEMSKVKMIEAKLPADMDFTAGLTSLAAGLATRLKLPADV